MSSISDDRIEQIQADLTAAGPDWPTVAAGLPELLTVVPENRRTYALVILDGVDVRGAEKVLSWRYDEDEPGVRWWACTGWSHESRSRITKPGQPLVDVTAMVERARVPEKLAAAQAMLEAAAADPEHLDWGFVADLRDYLEGR